MQSLEDARKPISRAEALERAIELLQSLGFDTTGWQDGRIQKSMITLFATWLADSSEVDRIIANGGYNEYAEGYLLELFSYSRFRNVKVPARATSGLCSLISVAPTSYALAAGALLASTAEGVEFQLAEAVTVAAGTVASPVTTFARFTARVKGAAGNVGTGKITNLLTPLAGVTITNSGNPWYDVSGRDLETDASLRLRNASKFSRLSVELIASAYENIAREAGASKVKVHASNPRGAGTIDVYCSGESAQLSNSELAAIQAVFSTHAFQTAASWPAASDDRVAVKKPPSYWLAISGVLYHDPGVSSAVIKARAVTALQDFLKATPLGGWDYTPGPANVIMYSDLIDVLKNVEGVYTVALTTPAGNVSVGTLDLILQGDWSGLTAVPRTV